MVGQSCFEAGSAKNTYGTGCFMLFNIGEKPYISTHGLLTTVGFQFGNNKPVYALEGSIAVAGSAIQWLRDGLGLIKESKEIGENASKVEDNGGVYFVTALSGLLAPYWKPEAKGTIVGLTQYATKSHICRAVLEAACFQTRAILESMNQDSHTELKSLKVDGGMTNSDFFTQIQSDLLGIQVERPHNKESTAWGAAIAAGLATGIWKDLKQLQDEVHDEKDTFKPTLSKEERDRLFGEWNHAVEKCIHSKI
jgi:glycerol kinase